MSKRTLLLSCNILALSFLASFALPVAAASDARISESYGKLPLHFEANQGQIHKDVRFLSRGAGYSLYLTADEAVLVLAKPNPDAKRDARPQAKPVALRMSLVGASRKPRVSGLDQLPGKANYFIGKDPAKGHTDVPTYAKVHYREVYPGIDLVYYGNQRQLEYDFVVAPGADPKRIVLGFKGADKLEIDAQGELVLRVAGNEIRQHKPVVYQEMDGVRTEIEGGYVLKGAKRVGFKLAAFDRNRPLVIDPVLAYSTYLGGSNDDRGRGIAVDAAGNAYVTGETLSINFPRTPRVLQTSFAGGFYDAFVTKLNSTGSALVYSTYLGGSSSDRGFGIAVDAGGNAYVTGISGSDNFPTTPGAFQRVNSGAGDAFVTKLNPRGSALIYSTFLGGSNSDSGFGIAVDTAGYAYVTGPTDSANFPTTAGAFQTTISGSQNAFVAKLNPAGSALVYSTYLGGMFSDHGEGIAVDADGNAYVTGGADSPNFPTTKGAFQAAFGGSADAFVAKLNPTGSALVYSTFLGGNIFDSGHGIAVDADGNAYVTGQTNSTNFPTTAGAFQTSVGAGICDPFMATHCEDGFVTKLDSTGSALVYSTYLGGSGRELGYAIAVDKVGSAYVAGWSDSTDFPTTAGAFQPVSGGGTDVFVSKLNPTGSALVYSSYLGGTGNDSGNSVVSIAVDANGNAYVTGATESSDFPITPGAFQTSFGGGTCFFGLPCNDAFVAKIADVVVKPLATAAVSAQPTIRSEESAATYTEWWPTYGAETGTFSGGTVVASNGTGASATFNFTGTALTWIGVKCSLCGIATVSIDGGAPATVDTAGPAGSNLTSEPVFSASGLAPDVSHTMTITVTGTSSSGGANVAVDAFDVTR